MREFVPGRQGLYGDKYDSPGIVCSRLATCTVIPEPSQIHDPPDPTTWAAYNSDRVGRIFVPFDLGLNWLAPSSFTSSRNGHKPS